MDPQQQQQQQTQPQPQFNYFQKPPIQPSSSISGSIGGGGGLTQQQTLNPFLLPNGAPSFKMPSLDALRPPPSFSSSKLITNPSVLQPPPSLNTPITNPLLTNPLLQKELPKFTPLTTQILPPSNIPKPSPITTMNVEQNKIIKAEDASEEDSFLSNSNKSISSVNSLKTHDPLLNSFNQNFQQKQTPFMNHQNPLFSQPQQFSPNYNQQFSLSPSIANVNLPPSSFNPQPQAPLSTISNLNQHQTPPPQMFQNFDQRQETPSPSISKVNPPTQPKISVHDQQQAPSPPISNQQPIETNQEESPNESQKQDSGSASEDVSTSPEDDSNTNNSPIQLNESTTTTTSTSDSSSAPINDQSINNKTTSFPQQTQNLFNPQLLMQNQPQPSANRPAFTPTPFKPASQTPVNFSPVPTHQQQIPRFGTITGPPQQSSVAQQAQFFSPTPLRPQSPQNMTRPLFMTPPPAPSTQKQQPPLFMASQPPIQQFIHQPNNGPPPLQNRQLSAPPPTISSNIQPQQTSGQMSSPPNFSQQQPPFATPPQLQQPFIQPPPSNGPPLGSNQNKPGNQLQYKYPSPAQSTDPIKSNTPFQQQSTLPPTQPPSVNQLASQLGNMGLKGQKPLAIDLLHEKRLLPPYDDNKELIRPKFPHEFYTNVNCHPEIIRSTLTAMPDSANLLSKCRLPLGILIHPFKDLESLKVVQSSTIVRCRNCRSYINPFVHFIDNTKWRCNLCYSVNDLPDEFLFDPVTRSYGDPSKRPEINSSTIEFIAPAEYTLRPPPPAMYLFLMDVSHNAVNTGYLQNACDILLESLDKLPGDTRTQIGFITFNSSIHFYNLSDSLSQPQMMVYPDIDDVVLPLPENLMINLTENKETIQTFLQDLPNLFNNTNDTENALGTALTAAFKLLTGTGGRVTVMQTCLPTSGVGSLKNRSESIDKDSQSLGPQTDFYKKLALECAGVHIAVDLFMFNALYADLATLSCISKYSGGEIKYYPEFHVERYPEQSDRFCFDFKRYLTRKIGFEAVMRVRCTRGLSIHTFHGNFFVRSTDLLALPNVNPDAGFGMQISIDESLTDVSTVCFQAALLYTSSKSERRIRIHTYCLPVSSNLNDLINGADQEAVIGLVAKMAVDRSIMNSVKEAKDALSNVAIDYLNAYSTVVTKQQKSSLLSPYSLRLVPLYVSALMKSMGFKYGNVKIDDRSYMLNVYKSMPLKYLLLYLYPSLYAVHNIDNTKTIVDSDTEICLPPRLHLSSESIDRHGVYILDACESIYMWIGRSVNDQFLQQVFNVKSFNELPDHASELPELDNVLSERIRNFIVYLYDQRPFGASFIFFREDSSKSHLFFQHIIEDKTENSISYVEFIRYLNDQVSRN